MRIIKVGNKLPVNEIECENCGTILEYLNKEVQSVCGWVSPKINKELHFINCPYCGERIVISEIEKEYASDGKCFMKLTKTTVGGKKHE